MSGWLDFLGPAGDAIGGVLGIDDARQDAADDLRERHHANANLLGMTRDFGTGRLQKYGDQVDQFLQHAKENYYNPDITQSPAYKFRLNQGLAALGDEGAANGALNSEGMQNRRMNFAQGLASQEANNVLRRRFQQFVMAMHAKHGFIDDMNRYDWNANQAINNELSAATGSEAQGRVGQHDYNVDKFQNDIANGVKMMALLAM